VLAALVAVSVVGVLAPVALAVFLVLIPLLILPWVAALSAYGLPRERWREAGRSRTRWVRAFFIVPLGVGAISSIVYLVWVRQRLPGDRLKVGQRVEVRPWGSDRGGVLLGRDWLTFGLLWRVRLEGPEGSQGRVRRLHADDLRHTGTGGGPAPGPQVAPRLRFFQIAAMTMVLGGGLLALALSDQDVLLSAFGGLVIAIGVAWLFITLWMFRPKRRLPHALRPPLDGSARGPRLFTLTLRDGTRILATSVLHGGFVLRRRTDPPLDAREVVEVTQASEEEIDAEWARIAKSDR